MSILQGFPILMQEYKPVLMQEHEHTIERPGPGFEEKVGARAVRFDLGFEMYMELYRRLRLL